MDLPVWEAKQRTKNQERGADGLAKTSRPKKVDFSCIEVREFPMSEEAAAKEYLCKAKTRKGDPVLISVSIEEYALLCDFGTARALRDACGLPEECGRRATKTWSVVWDSKNGASFLMPRRDGRRFSDFKFAESPPIRISKIEALMLL